MSKLLEGKIALVTGANSGLGKEVAIELAKLGATIVMFCRDHVRGEAAQHEIIAATGNPCVELILANLASQQSIREAVDTFKQSHDRLHLLINSAGTSLMERRLSPDGIEVTFATNHLAPFLLTNLLLDVICETAAADGSARIVNVGTRINTTLKFDDLQFEKRRYNGLIAYAESKLGNIMFTFDLAERLQGSGVTVNVVHPGVFRSNLGNTDSKGNEPFFLKWVTTIFRPFLPSAATAAKRVIYLATAPELTGVTGKYFGNRIEIPAPAQTHNSEVRSRLWAISETLTRFHNP